MRGKEEGGGGESELARQRKTDGNKERRDRMVPERVKERQRK